MRCPFGYDDHPVTGRCYAAYVIDWFGGWCPPYRLWAWLLLKVEI